MTLSTLSELQDQLALLTTRIAALDRDIALEMDRERRATMQTRRDDLAREREKIAADITLQGGVPQPGQHIEHRVTTLEKEVDRIKKIIQPGPKHRLARFLFYSFMVGLAAIWLDPASRQWLIENPWQGLAITAALICAMAIVLYLPEDAPYV